MRLYLIGTIMLVAAGCLQALPAGNQPAKERDTRPITTQASATAQRAVQQGKGSGWTRTQVVLRGSAYRAQTAQDVVARVNSLPSHPRWSDSALHK